MQPNELAVACLLTMSVLPYVQLFFIIIITKLTAKYHIKSTVHVGPTWYVHLFTM